MTLDSLSLPDRRLAFQRQVGKKGSPGIIFLGGFASDMTGTKAGYLSECCKTNDFSYLRFDYSGNGQSSGEFKDGTIGQWLEDALAVFDRLTEGSQIVVGSSMGGWLALLLALQRPERIKAIVGVAAAPDFTEDLMWDVFTPLQRMQIQRDGMIYENTAPAEHNPPITLRLIEEGRTHLLLRQPIQVICPVRLLQGKLDADVPWTHAQRIADKLTSSDVKIHYIEDGDHRLSRDRDLALLWDTISRLL